MRREGWSWGGVLAAVMLAQACSPSRVEPAPGVPGREEEPPSAEAPSPTERTSDAPTPVVQAPEERAPENAEATPPAQHSPEPTPELTCERLMPAPLGPSQGITVRGNDYSDGAYYAHCGPGTSDGAGFLALLNHGPYGTSAWNVVSPEGSLTGKMIFGGDLTNILVPQPSGFYYAINTFSPGGLIMSTYTSGGERLAGVRLTSQNEVPYSLVPMPQGGALMAMWEPREGGNQVLTAQLFDPAGAPRTERLEVATVSASSTFILAGVDVRGRTLLLRHDPSGGGFLGQWLERDGRALTQPFPVDLPEEEYAWMWQLHPLAGGGLALRNGSRQWIASFPSGRSQGEPAPDWLAKHPGSDLFLIRGQRAQALVPPPVMRDGAGCQASLLLFTQEGTACGELRLPPVGTHCDAKTVNIGVDGTIVQQLDPLHPEEKICDEEECDDTPKDSMCAWRWWPGALN